MYSARRSFILFPHETTETEHGNGAKSKSNMVATSTDESTTYYSSKVMETIRGRFEDKPNTNWYKNNKAAIHQAATILDRLSPIKSDTQSPWMKRMLVEYFLANVLELRRDKHGTVENLSKKTEAAVSAFLKLRNRRQSELN